MIGYYRYFLALCVLFSHCGVSYFGLNLGWCAVWGFFVLAGHANSKIFCNIFRGDVKLYARSRFLRLYPSFFVWLSVAYIVVIIFSIPLQTNIKISQVVLEYLMIPISYFFLIDLNQIKFGGPAFDYIVGPYWTLGLEAQAYAMIALLFCLKRRHLFEFAGAASFVMFLLATVQLFTTDRYYTTILNYGTVFSTFFAFYIGILIQQNAIKSARVSYLIFVVSTIFLIFTDSLNGASMEAFVGISCSIIALFANRLFSIKLKRNRLYGNMSYQLYLCHFIVVIISDCLLGYIDLIFCFVVSVILAFTAARVEWMNNLSVEQSDRALSTRSLSHP